MSDEIVPFGKHKGQPVEVLANDKEYVAWLMAQDWFKQRYANIYQIVINNGQQPTETPEHNAMQIKFLEEEYRCRFAYVALGGSESGLFNFITPEAVRRWYQETREAKNALVTSWPERAQSGFAVAQAEYQQAVAQCEGCQLYRKRDGEDALCYKHKDSAPSLPEMPTFPKRISFSGVEIFKGNECRDTEESKRLLWASKPVFEKPAFGWGLQIYPAKHTPIDVQYLFHWGFTHDYPARCLQLTGRSSCNTASKATLRIEIKPTVGDDYPAVLRQVEQSGAKYLLVGSYTGVGATRDQFVAFFDSQGVKVVFETDVGAAILPDLNRGIEGLFQ